MANVNKVFLIGNLTRDPELRYTPQGTAVGEFGIAINRQWKGPNGEKKEEVCFVDCQAWARGAEIISEYCKKGSSLFVEGRLKLDSWEGKDGQKRSRMRVVVENFQFLGAPTGRRAPAEGAPGGGQGSPQPPPRGRPRAQEPEGPPADAGADEPPESAPEGGKVNDEIPF
ncbi:MAG: single-stranded DNA-binding protein [Candidatus Brocadiia bacterium]